MLNKKKIHKTNFCIKKIKKENKKNFSISLWIVSVFFLFLVFIWISKQLSNMEFDFDNIINITGLNFNLEELQKESIIKSTDWKTNILIIWRWWEENDAPDLTDSILIWSINYKKNIISLFSIPRDLYVNYPTWSSWKINETYFRGIKKHWRNHQAIEPLKEIIKKITQEDIHYYVDLDFDWFKKIIDTVWWIEIDVPNRIVDYDYPGPNHSFQTFIINKWLQTLNWDVALKYARSRHSTSDFDRSLRQQLIIKWLQNKIISLWFLTNPWKITSLYNIIKENILTDLDLKQIISLALFIKDTPKDNIVSSNLNDSCFYWSDVCEKWWFLYVPLRSDFSWMSVLLQNWATKYNLNNYDELYMYMNFVFNYPEMFLENPKIAVYNSTKIPWLALKLVNNFKRYGFNVSIYNIWNTKWEIHEKTKIITRSQEKTITLEVLEMFIFGWIEYEEEFPKYSTREDIDIEIIIWNDYKYLNL